MQTATTNKRAVLPRYVFELPVRAEWSGPSDDIQWVRAIGRTANIGPGGALVHLNPLPQVGSLVRLFISNAEAPTISCYEVETLVLRVDYDAGEPLAALMVPGGLTCDSAMEDFRPTLTDDNNGDGSWLNRVYEPSLAAMRAALETPFSYSFEEDEEDGENESWSYGRIRKEMARDKRVAKKGHKNERFGVDYD